MKLAVLGAAAIVVGLVAPVDGLVAIGSIWVVGGGVLRLTLGPPRQLPRLDATASWRDALAGRRGVGVVVSILIGVATLVVGVGGIGFGSDDAVWRWTAVAVGGVVLGVQLLAMAAFAAGSRLQAMVGDVGDPTHPATIRLDSVAETGVHVDRRPRLQLGLTVRPRGRPPYEVEVKQVIATTDLGKVRRGTTYRGLVDPELPEGVAIDWHDVVGDTASHDTALHDTTPHDTAPHDIASHGTTSHDIATDDPVADAAADDGGATPEPAAGQPSDDELAARLVELDGLLRDGEISAAEHARARRAIFDSL